MKFRAIIALVAAAATAVVLVALPSGAAHAQTPQTGSSTTLTAQLAQLNNSGASGTATIVVTGDQLAVTITSTGLTPGVPHAQHVHIGGTHTCPTASADTDGDGIVNTTEGLPSYGDIKVSLTTVGDLSPSSGLAVTRFPVGGADGAISYSRTFTLPAGVTAADISQGVVVQHGIDLNHNGMYDGAAKSDLDPTLPQEATVPADCGKLVAQGTGTTTTPAAGGGVSTPATSSTPAASGTAAGAATTPSTGVTVPNTGTGPGNGGNSVSWILLAGIGALALGGAFAFGAARTRRN